MGMSEGFRIQRGSAWTSRNLHEIVASAHLSVRHTAVWPILTSKAVITGTDHGIANTNNARSFCMTGIKKWSEDELNKSMLSPVKRNLHAGLAVIPQR